MSEHPLVRRRVATVGGRLLDGSGRHAQLRCQVAGAAPHSGEISSFPLPAEQAVVLRAVPPAPAR
eukprot:2913498-Prymnesium_polylepis.1